MAATVKRHRIPTQFQSDQNREVVIERVSVGGLSVTGGSEAEVAFDIRTAIIAATGYSLTGHDDYRLQGIIIDSVGPTDAEARLYWTKDLVFGFEPDTAILTESTTLLTKVSQYIPQTRVKFEVPAAAPFLVDTARISILMPHRVVTAQILSAGDPGTDYGNLVGWANKTAWRGLGVGYWLLAEHTTAISKYTGYYQKRISAITRVMEDWSEIAVLQTPDGHYYDVPSGTWTATIAPAYSFGVIYSAAGIARWGPYPVTEFSTIFGF